MSHILEDLKVFLDQSPTAWHAAQQIGNRLAVKDFSPLEDDEKWKLETGGKYFVVRGGALCAFILSEEKPHDAVILASHTDSPALKIKPSAEYQKENMTLIGVEVYGAPLLTSWLNRDLAIAGRVVVTNANDEREEKLVFIDDAALFIPQLAIHLDREVNEKGLHVNKQDHLNAIARLTETGKEGSYLENQLRQHLSFHTLLSFDLFLVPLEESRFLGSKNEMLSSYRLDNLASAHAAATAMGLSKRPKPKTLQIAVFWDNEEVGSRSKEGAASPFLQDILKRICHFYKMNVEEEILLKNRSLCLSIDMSHALNPNYSNKSEPNHSTLLGKGIVVKYNADQKYVTNAQSAAAVIHCCKRLNMPYQSFVTRSDLTSGSTVGPIMAAQGIATADIGCPQLSMHSAREVMAAQDHIDMCHLLSAMLQGEES